jgi:hypothetical protein
MDIKILRNKNELDGTCYMELLPGKYDGKCWSDTSIFFDEEVFGLLEPIIEKHAKGYDHYAFTEVDKNTWSKIISDLENVQKLLKSDESSEELQQHLGFLFKNTETEFFENLDQNKQDTDRLIKEFVAWLKDKLASNEVISILGI